MIEFGKSEKSEGDPNIFPEGTQIREPSEGGHIFLIFLPKPEEPENSYRTCIKVDMENDTVSYNYGKEGDVPDITHPAGRELSDSAIAYVTKYLDKRSAVRKLYDGLKS